MVLLVGSTQLVSHGNLHGSSLCQFAPIGFLEWKGHRWGRPCAVVSQGLHS